MGAGPVTSCDPAPLPGVRTIVLLYFKTLSCLRTRGGGLCVCLVGWVGVPDPEPTHTGVLTTMMLRYYANTRGWRMPALSHVHQHKALPTAKPAVRGGASGRKAATSAK